VREDCHAAPGEVVEDKLLIKADDRTVSECANDSTRRARCSQQASTTYPDLG
jgi:hypothetical protein